LGYVAIDTKFPPLFNGD